MAMGGRRPGAGRKPGKVGAAKRAMAEQALEHVGQAFATLATEMVSGDTSSARISAATAILDRAYGKPALAMTVGNPDGSPMMPAVIQIVAATAKAETDDGEDGEA